MAKTACCDRNKPNSFRLVTDGKERHTVEWCDQHSVWALRLCADLMLERSVFPGSKIVHTNHNQGRLFNG